MAVANGFGKVVTSGSVFMYDTGDTINSYKGEPTTNTVGNLNSFNPLDLYTWASSGNTSTWSRDPSAPLSPVNGIPLKEVSFGTDSYSSTYNNPGNNVSAASSGQTWTVSVYALANAGTNLQIWIFGANSSGNYIELDARNFTATGQWQRISVSMTFTNGSTSYIQARVATATNGATIWWDGLQIEQKSYPTQFTTGTRSVTQGLLPLIGNSTINLSTVSFDSNAQMYFDGTDDYFEIPYSSILDTPNGCTYEMIIYRSNGGTIINRGTSDAGSTPDNPRVYIYPSGGSEGIVYFDWSSVGTDRYAYSNIALNANTYYHLTLTATPGGNLKIYINTIDSTGTSSGGTLPNPLPNTTNPIQVGAGTWIPNYFSGKLPILKIYNRALSTAEIKQNYNKYKTRFNLS